MTPTPKPGAPAPTPKFFYGHGTRKLHLLETHTDCGLMREGRYYSLCKRWWTLNPTRTDILPPGLLVCERCRVEEMRRTGMFAEAIRLNDKLNNRVFVRTANGRFWMRIESSDSLTSTQRRKFAQRLADLINEHVNLGEY